MSCCEDDYKYIGFDIHFYLLKGIVYKTVFINFSFHALQRILERCDIKEISSPQSVKFFLSTMIKPILFRCLSMCEEKFQKVSVEPRNDKSTFVAKMFEKSESYVIYNNLFMPIVIELGKNIDNKVSYTFTIKTVMPDSYNGAQKSIKEKELNKPKDSIFDYIELVRHNIKPF